MPSIASWGMICCLKVGKINLGAYIVHIVQKHVPKKGTHTDLLVKIEALLFTRTLHFELFLLFLDCSGEFPICKAH